MELIHKTSSPEFPQSNVFVEEAIQTTKKTLRKCREDNSGPQLAMLALRATRNSFDTFASELLNTSTFVKRKRKHQMKLKKPTVSQSRVLQLFNTSVITRITTGH